MKLLYDTTNIAQPSQPSSNARKQISVIIIATGFPVGGPSAVLTTTVNSFWSFRVVIAIV